MIMSSFMPNLWDVFVVSIFGGFWLSTVGLIVVFSLILMLGGVSPFSIMTFCMLFLIAMTMGYGYTIVTIFVSLGIIIYGVSQMYKLITQT